MKKNAPIMVEMPFLFFNSNFLPDIVDYLVLPVGIIKGPGSNLSVSTRTFKAEPI